MYYLAYKVRYFFAKTNISGTQMIVGLGNPGPQYSSTRHNVGQLFVKQLSRSLNVQFEKIAQGEIAVYQSLILFNPVCFMNLSGGPVSKIANKYNIPIQNILVVHDDLDNHVGKCKLKNGGSAEGHNGLKSIIQSMSADFSRLKIGIGRPQSKDPEVIGNYVLEKMDYRETMPAFTIGFEIVKKLYKF